MEFYRVSTTTEAKELIRIMPDVVAIDTEYVKGDPRVTKLLSVIVADEGRAWAISPSLLPMLAQTIQSRKLIFLQDYNHCDTIILYKNGCDIRDCNTFNLIDMHHLLDENAEHDLGSRILSQYMDNYKREFWDKYNNYEDASEDEALEYACKDAIYTYRLGLMDYVGIDNLRAHSFEGSQNNLLRRDLYGHIRRLSRVLLDTELEGVCVNEDLMKQTKITMKTQIDDCLPKLREEFNEYCKIWEMQKWASEIDKRSSDRGKSNVPRPVFSFTSDKQLSWLVYEALKSPVIQKTKKGNPSTDFDTLQTLAKDDARLEPLVIYKDLKGVYSTFVEGMLERVQNGRIYPHFNVSGTATGRISHSDPNMGNLPKEGVIRNFFVPSPGMVIIGADYEQLEVVIELNLTEDPGLREIVVGGASKHDLFMDELHKAGFKLPRSQVKNINFALQYGAGSKKVSKMVGCSTEDAERIISVFYSKFSGVKRLKDEVSSTVEREGQVTNLAGRTRRFDKPKNKYELYRQQRQAYNFLIQGVAGEACNRAYYRFHDSLWDSGSRYGRGLFTVHDEIVAEIEDGMFDIGMAELVRIMQQSTNDFNFKYPLKAKAYGPLTMWSKT